MNSNAPNAMIARLKQLSGPPDAVITKGRNIGKTPNAIITWENGLDSGLDSLIKEVRVFKVKCLCRTPLGTKARRVLVQFVALRVCRPAREPKTGKPPKVLPRVLSGVLSGIGELSGVLSGIGVLSRVLLRGALPVVLHRKNPCRALSGALLTAPRFLRALPRALSGALSGVSLFWAL